jgi:hypothetical protein
MAIFKPFVIGFLWFCWFLLVFVGFCWFLLVFVGFVEPEAGKRPIAAFGGTWRFCQVNLLSGILK